MDENSIEQGQQVIYINENAVILEGDEEVQYIIPSEMTENGGYVVQDNGLHYLMDQIQDKSDVSTVGQVEYEMQPQENMGEDLTDDGNQIFQMNEDDSVTQIVLGDEQFRMLQGCGHVLLQQGNRKFLLDASGLQEVDPLTDEKDLENMHSIVPEPEYRGAAASLVPYKGDDGGCEVVEEAEEDQEGTAQEVTEREVCEDSKETVYQYLKNGCTFVVQEEAGAKDDNIKQSVKSNDSQIVYIEEVSESECQTLKSKDHIGLVPSKVKGTKDLQQSLKSRQTNQQAVLSLYGNEVVSLTKEPLSRKRPIVYSNTTLAEPSKKPSETKKRLTEVQSKKDGDKKKISSYDADADCDVPQIKNGKIVMGPKHVNSMYTKKFLKMHYKKMKEQWEGIQVPKEERQLSELDINRKTIKMLEQLKQSPIYIGDTPEGKKIYGKVIDYRPSPKIFSKARSKESPLFVDLSNEKPESPEPKDSCRINILNPGKRKGEDSIIYSEVKMLNFEKEKLLPESGGNVKTLKCVSGESTIIDMTSDVAEVQQTNDQVVVEQWNDIATVQETAVTSQDSDVQVEMYHNVENKTKPDQFEIQQIVELNNDLSLADMHYLNQTLSSIVKAPSSTKAITTRNLLVVKESIEDKGPTISQIYTGRMVKSIDNGQEQWNFEHSSVPQGGVMVNDYLVVKLTRDQATDSTKVIIMEKAKTKGKNLNQLLQARAQYKARDKIKKSLTCQFCKKVFVRWSSLSRHLTVHGVTDGRGGEETDRVYNCGQCDCVFRFPSTLTRHMLQEHTSEVALPD